MRLLNTSTGQFRSVDEPRQVTYAILSHVWACTDEDPPEQTYEDVKKILKRSKRLWSPTVRRGARLPSKLSEKIRRCCAIARDHGFDSVWCDSCCIDKSSSSELSEAINSMFSWYQHAKVCYAYLYDVDDDDDPRARDSQFRRSRWFTRGWTLQEMIAPRVVIFLSKGWRVLGTKTTLASVIEEVTGIDYTILTNETPLDTVSVARRISWASRRQTKREEDEAYSLMGLLGVNMPTIYGEGRFAFIRLQEEVLKHTSDQSLFAWGPALRDNAELVDDIPLEATPDDEEAAQTVWANMRNLFALSPRAFASSKSVLPRLSTFREQLGLDCPLPEYATTGHGIRTTVPLLTTKSSHSGELIHLAILACQDDAGRCTALVLRQDGERSRDEYFVGAFLSRPMTVDNDDSTEVDLLGDILLGELYFRTIHLSPRFIAAHRSDIRLREIYIADRPSRAGAQAFARYMETHIALTRCPAAFEVDLTGWSRSLLEHSGFIVSTLPSDPNDDWVPASVVKRGFVLTKRDRAISVLLDRCCCEGGLAHRWVRVVVSSHHPTDHPLASPSQASVEKKPEDPVKHSRYHQDHVCSWFFATGVASRQIHVQSSESGGTGWTVQLTLSIASLETACLDRQYALGVEIFDSPRSKEKPSLDNRRLSSSDHWVPPLTVVSPSAVEAC